MKQLLIPAALWTTSLVAVAGPAVSESAPLDMPPPLADWEFRLTPYAWLTAIDGTTGPQGFPAEIDAGFDDIFDVFEMAAALQFEARRDRWGFMADAFYAELGTSGILPGPLKTNIDLDVEQFLGEFVVFYRASESPRSLVDLYAGIRYNSISLDLQATTEAARKIRPGSG